MRTGLSSLTTRLKVDNRSLSPVRPSCDEDAFPAGRQILNKAVEVDASDIPRSVHHTVVGRDGMIYASSFLSNEVFSGIPDEKGMWRWVRVVGKTGGPDGPTGIALDEQLRLYVASFGTDQIMRYDR